MPIVAATIQPLHNPLLEQLNRENKGFKINDITTNCQVYADDIVLFAESHEDMKHQLMVLENFLEYSRLKININKCKVLSYVYDKSTKHRIYDQKELTINGQRVPQVNLG